MPQADLTHATVTNALAKLDAWRSFHRNGVAPTHKRQLLLDMLASATGVAVPPVRGEPGYVYYGSYGLELALDEFENKLVDRSFNWSNANAKRELIVKLVDRIIKDLREDTAPGSVFGISYNNYTPTWTDANSDFIEDALQPPQLLTAPTVSGTPNEGQTLSVTNGTWTGPTPTFAYQWYRNSVAVAGATNNTFALVVTDPGDPNDDPPVPPTPGDLGRTIQVRVTATNANGSNSWLSPGIVVVAP
jgi:hypothetical protein